MLAVKMIVHYGRAAVGGSPLFHRQGFVADASRTLRFKHQERKFVGFRRFLLYMDICKNLIHSIDARNLVVSPASEKRLMVR